MSNRVWRRRRDPDWRKRRDGYWWWYIRLENGRTAWARAGYSSDQRLGRKRS